jgi:hypothetical protein
MTHRGGKKLLVKVTSSNGDIRVLTYKTDKFAVTPVKLVNGEIEGRPSQVLKNFIKRGFEEHWWDDLIINELVKWGFSEKLWKDFDTLTWKF